MADFTITTPIVAMGAGTATRAITLTTTATTGSTTSFALSDGGAGGGFYPSSPVTINAGAGGQTTQFVYIPEAAALGTITLSVVATGGIAATQTLSLPIGGATRVFTDTFVDTATTALSAHTATPDGGTYVKEYQSNGQTIVIGSQSINLTSGAGAVDYLSSAAPTLATDYDASAVMTVYNLGVNGALGILVQDASVSGGPVGYWCTYFDPSSLGWLIYKFGANVILSSMTLTPTPTTGGVMTVCIRSINGLQYILLLYNGALVAGAQDSSLTSGKVGIFGEIQSGNPSSSAGLQFGEFEVDNVDWHATPATFPNSAIYQSPYNWVPSSGAIIACTPGGYLKGQFSGATGIEAAIDTTLNNGISLDLMPSLKAFVVDLTQVTVYGRIGVGGPWLNVQIPSNNTNGTPVGIVTGLDPTHLYYYEIHTTGTFGHPSSSQNGWSNTQSWSKINSLTFHGAAVLSATTPLPQNIVVIGDSLSEGYYGDPSNQASYNYLDPTTTCWVWVAAALNAEAMVKGIGSIGFVENFADYGFPTIGASWNYLSQSNAINFTTPGQPSIIFIWGGVNDFGQSPSAVQSAVTSLIAAIRGTAGCGTATMIFVIPTNQFMQASIVAGVAASGDAKAYTLNPTTGVYTYGENFFAFVQGATNVSFMSGPDGIHINRIYHGLMGSIIATGTRAILDSQASTMAAAVWANANGAAVISQTAKIGTPASYPPGK